MRAQALLEGVLVLIEAILDQLVQVRQPALGFRLRLDRPIDVSALLSLQGINIGRAVVEDGTHAILGENLAAYSFEEQGLKLLCRNVRRFAHRVVHDIPLMHFW